MSHRYTKKIKDMLEKGIEKSCKDHARSIGILSRKFTSPARRSVPDDLFAINGVVFFIEFKRWGQRPTENQLKEHEELRAAGLRVYVVDNVVDGRALLDLIVLRTRGKTPPSLHPFSPSPANLPGRIYWTGYADRVPVADLIHRFRC